MIKRLFAAVALLCVSLASPAQVTVAPILLPHQTFVDQAGLPCAGCSLYSFTAGTTIPKPTYTDASGGVQNPNPIVLNVQGGASIWVDNTTAYKFVLKSALGATIWTADYVESPGNTSIISNPTGSQSIYQLPGTSLVINTSAGGKLIYNGNEVLTTGGGAVLTGPSATQTVLQPGGTTLAITVPGTATGRLSTTPVNSITMTDASALATDGTLAGDVHLTPYFRANIVSNGPNDNAAYEAIQCNYTGSGATGNCIPHFFIVSSVAGDKHTGIWGGNAIVTEQVNTPSFGWETNTFNEIVDGNILPNGNYDAGPFFGIAATAGYGTGQFKQQAAFVAVNDYLGGTGGGWDYDLYGISANNGVVLCGTPTTTTIPACIIHSAYGVATSSNNYAAVPDISVVDAWNGSANSQHIVTEQAVPIPSTGVNPNICKSYSFDGVDTFDICAGGSTASGPFNVHAASGGQTLTIGQTFSDTAHPAQATVVVDSIGNTAIQATQQGTSVRTLALNPAGGNTSMGGGVLIQSSNFLPQVGTPVVGQAACIKAAGPPVVIGYCSTVVSAGGACTCN